MPFADGENVGGVPLFVSKNRNRRERWARPSVPPTVIEYHAMAHLTTKKGPHSDFNQPKVPQHDYPYSWLGDPTCLRCGCPMSEMDSKPCLTDEQIRDARIMGRIVKRLRHG